MRVLSSMSVAFRLSPLLVHTFALAMGWLLLMRAILGFHSGVWPVSPLAALSDLIGALLLTILLLLLRLRWMRFLLVLVLAMGFYTAGEHLAAHGTLFRLPHVVSALDPTFVRSASVLGAGLLAFPAYWVLAWLLHRLQRRIAARQPPHPPGHLYPAVAGIVLVTGYTLAVPSLTAPANNVVATMLAQAPYTLVRFQAPAGPETVERIDRDVAALFFQQRLANRVVETPPDILVIMIEGLSAAYFPTIANYHGLQHPAVVLPGLERGLEQRNFRLYRNVLSMQRKTDRGSYAMLCGEYPHLDSAPSKMTAVAQGETPPDCLPAVLGRNGYYTSYQQGADLGYMAKDRFMPRIGFDEALGAADLVEAEEIEGWGLMDTRFFDRAGDRIHALDRERDQPWFATLLNVGTHHPFPELEEGETTDGDMAVFDPESPEIPVEQRHHDRQAAFSTMSGELLGLLDRLERDGVLTNTMVIVTSDESGGFIRGDGDPGPLDGNFGVMAVRSPTGFDRQYLRSRDELVAHIDIAPTLVDAAGLGPVEGGAGGPIGHSLLAPETGRERGILLGDTYAAQSMFLLSSGRLMRCAETLLRCDAWTFEPERLFGTLESRADNGFLDLEMRRRLAEHASLIGQEPPGE